jgi:cyclopropane-fatty-acyl-phospholipid synthase
MPAGGGWPAVQNPLHHPLLDHLDACIRDARLRIRSERGERVIGSAPEPRDDVVLRVSSARFLDRVLADRNLGIAESYMDGDFELESGTLEDLLVILLRNRVDRSIPLRPGLALKAAAVRLRSRLRTKRANAAAHYDRGLELFESFLDESLGYSCGFARDPADSADELQRGKYERICRKLRLRPGHTLVDIGCGFGGLLIHACQRHGATGLGVTNSRLHWSEASERVRKAGLADRLTIQLGDYADVRGRYDRLSSVGMLEHVPRREYGRFFRKLADRLARDGLGLVHAIGLNGAKNRHDRFIQKYVFPGSRQPKLSEIASQLERSGLAILDVENVVRHYALTALRWRERFRANRHGLDPERYDERFQRMWDYYLTCGIAAATASDAAVYQVLFARDYSAPIPLQRV